MAQISLSGNDKLEAVEKPVVQADPLFWAATSLETLTKAWERVKFNQGAPGGDGVTVDRFDFFAKQALPSLSQKLRDFSYRPGKSRRVYVPKKSGGMRPLDIPNVVDRIAQGAASLVLTPPLDALMEPSSFAYRPGRGVADAVARVSSLRRQGFTHVIDADISRYFENVPHEHLLRKLEAVVGDDGILDLVALWLEWYAPSGKGLAQGSPLSPLLANLYLDSLDETFEGRGLRIVRYADDFVLLCKSEAIAEATLPKLTRFLSEHGLELNAEKTRVVPFEKGFRFLGHLFVRSMVLKEVIDDTPSEESLLAFDATTGFGEPAPKAAPFTEHLGEDIGNRARAQHVLYVVEPGRHLTTQGESFSVTSGEEKLLLLPKRRVDRIEIGPGNSIDVDALDLAAAGDIDLVRVNGHGETLGTWSSPDLLASRARRHLAQAGLILDPQRRVELARLIVDGRIRGQRALLHRINRSRDDGDTAAAIVQMNRALRKLTVAATVETCMGHEGEAAALYWPAIGRGLIAPLTFHKRRRRPAGTAFDLVLNALAAILHRDIRVALMRAGLHPGFSVLHSAQDGEDALTYDLMEEFRAPMIEATALALVNRKAITPAMFDDGQGSPKMDRSGWAALVRGYEAAAARAISSPRRAGVRVSWRQLMSDQAQNLAAHFEGRELYAPAVSDY